MRRVFMNKIKEKKEENIFALNSSNSSNASKTSNTSSSSNASNASIASNTSRTSPDKIIAPEYMFPAFKDENVLFGKTQGRLPVMGWNSWNAFGSKNSEELTIAMANAIVDLGLAELGYSYVVLDDGCYKSERLNGLLANEKVKFPNGFRKLSNYIHGKGLKFGMYNDIGTHLCAGSAVGTCGHEDIDAKTYLEWGVDFLKVDNCYYLWDNATFSDERNAKYTYAPNIRSITVSRQDFKVTMNAVEDGRIIGRGASKIRDDFMTKDNFKTRDDFMTRGNYVTNIGTFDGTNIGTTPIGEQSGELEFIVNAPSAGEYVISVNFASGEETGVGRWLQLAVGNVENETRYFDNLLPLTQNTDTFIDSEDIRIKLNKGNNIVRLMNHRRQENTLHSYATLFADLKKYAPDNDIVLAICEWGKTQPQNWGYKVGDSWRILNDITFCVGSDGDPGTAEWSSNNTASITSQYNKAVIMDEFAGLKKGWNDPDMLVIGMNGLNNAMCRTHMSMWCMMNAPLMLGMDLRRMVRGDDLWKIIANKDLISLNQDKLGIQAKRIYCSVDSVAPDTAYITNNDRVDILAKPLENGDIALSFINLSDSRNDGVHTVEVSHIIDLIGHKMVDPDKFKNAKSYYMRNLWTGNDIINYTKTFSVSGLDACDNVTLRISLV